MAKELSDIDLFGEDLYALDELRYENARLRAKVAELEKQLAWPRVAPPKKPKAGPTPTSVFPTNEQFRETLSKWGKGEL